MSNKIESREKLIKILTKMFQFDQADLDFGIYRIMNQKRDRIEEFMNKELFSNIEKSLEPLESNINQSKIDEVENKISTLNSMNDDGSFDQKIKELKDEIESFSSSSNTDGIEAEIYSHLTDFFRRYYDEGDFISQRRYKDGVYAIPYEGEEVKLHWANYDQYYIKSSEYFYDYTFKTSFGEKVNFKLIDIKAEKDNNKGDRKTFQIIEDMENNPELLDDELYVYFQYTEDKTTQKKRNEESVSYLTEKINSLKLLNYEPMLRKEKRGVSSEIEKQINRYTARNTYDYFIHKDLEKFLTRELDFYIKNEVLHLENMDPEEVGKLKEYIIKSKVIESIANTIIVFLAQLEEFQKSLWLKKKFIVETNYSITLDRIDRKFYDEIINNDKQRKEWIKLFDIDELEDYSDSLTIEFLNNNPYLMLDTKFFDNDFKESLIGSIDNLDESIDGVLINSDNFHALNLLQERYKDKIDCVYIDPPYNTNASSILYKNDYKDSSWLSLMKDRLLLSNNLMDEKSMISIAIDDEEVDVLRRICNIIFKKNMGIACVRSNPVGRKTTGRLTPLHEYVLFYGKSNYAVPNSIVDIDSGKKRYPYIDEVGRYSWLNFIRSGNNDLRSDAPTMYYPIIVTKNDQIRIPEMKYLNDTDGYEILENISSDEEIVYPIKIENNKLIEKNWQRSWKRVIREYSEYRVRRTKKGISIDFKARQDSTAPPKTWWDNAKYASSNHGSQSMKNFFGESQFSYPKAPELVKDCIRICGLEDNEEGVVIDYFAGSGTTGHAVINLNREDNGRRKYVLVEMGEYFSTVTKPRIQKIVYSEDWKDGKPVSRKGSSHAFKYFSLESYEDALNNIIFEKDDMFNLLPKDSDLLNEYTMSYMLFEETKESKCLLNIDELKDPFNYIMKIIDKGEQKEKKIDIIESFNYLIGLKIFKNHSTQIYDAEFTESEHGKISATITSGKTYKFKTIEGVLPTGESALIVWRNTTGDSIKDNEALNTFLNEKRIKTSDVKYDVIYVNGDNFIKNINLKGDLKVKLIEVEMKRKILEEVVI